MPNGKKKKDTRCLLTNVKKDCARIVIRANKLDVSL